MKVFVTGATGWIGSAVVPELLGAGHDVIGLARTAESAAALSAAGATAHEGSLTDPDSLRRAAETADGVIHLAFRHDIAFSGDFAGAAASDLEAIEAMGEVLAGTDRPLVIAGGVLGLEGDPATERDTHAGGAGALRGRSAAAALALAGRGVRSSVVRLSPSVHGAGDPGFVATLVDVAKATGVSAYVGDGHHRWPAVHRHDAATLFRLALESAPAGSVLHGVAEEGVRLRDVAEAIGRHLDLPTRSVPADQAADHFGWLSMAVGEDTHASSDFTQELLGWRPSRPGLLADLATGAYFDRVD